jgi:hypothetical protein
MTRTKPKWSDEKAVFDFIEQKHIEDILHLANQNPFNIELSEWLSNYYFEMERDAVHAVENGNIAPLAGLLHPEHPDNLHGGNRPVRSMLSESTWVLIYELLIGARKRKRGAAKQTLAQRKRANPIHNAAEVTFPSVRAWLKTLYPERKPKEISDRALEITVKLEDLKSVEALINYLARSRKDRRRVRARLP